MQLLPMPTLIMVYKSYFFWKKIGDDKNYLSNVPLSNPNTNVSNLRITEKSQITTNIEIL